MERRRKQNSRDYNVNINWIIWIFIIAGVLTFIISYTMYGNKVEENIGMKNNIDNETGISNGLLNNIENEEVTKVNLNMGKTIDDVENSTEEDNKEENNNTKIAVNTSEIENKVIAERQKINDQDKEEEVVVQDPTFIRPVDGEIVKKYSKDNLLYSNTLQEWTTHLGIDFEAEKTSIVKASADGKIKSIKNDPRYGLTVIIEHCNGFTSMYANLLSAEFITVGEEVKGGQTIATVGNTATFEILDDTHLHFEIMKNGENVDPSIYIK